MNKAQVVSPVCVNCDLILLRLLPSLSDTVLLAPTVDFQISLAEITLNEPPGELLPDYAYLAAMNVQFLVNGLPDQQIRWPMQIGFTIPPLPVGTLDRFVPLILYWDTTLNNGLGGWVEMVTLLKSSGRVLTFASQPGLYVLVLRSVNINLDCGTGNVWEIELPSGVIIQIPCTENLSIALVPIISSALPGSPPIGRDYLVAFYIAAFQDDTRLDFLPSEGKLEYPYSLELDEVEGMSIYIRTGEGWQQLPSLQTEEATLLSSLVTPGLYVITISQ